MRLIGSSRQPVSKFQWAHKVDSEIKLQLAIAWFRLGRVTLVFVVGVPTRAEPPQALVASGRGALLSDALMMRSRHLRLCSGSLAAPGELQRRAGFRGRRSHRQAITYFSTLQNRVPSVHRACSTTASFRSLRANRAPKLRRDEGLPRPFMMVLATRNRANRTSTSPAVDI